jgi:DNA-binding NarL/FixJ family response regulator
VYCYWQYGFFGRIFEVQYFLIYKSIKLSFINPDMNILIADDHAIVRKGLVGLLREEFTTAHIQEASNGPEALNKALLQQWDLILLDISMPGKTGIEVLKELRSGEVKTPVLMLSMQPEDQYAMRALKAGASGFVNKDSATEDLITAVRKVLSGRKYISESVAEKLSSADTNFKKFGAVALSNREMQVLQLIASGKTISDIAAEISLSVNTISTYRSRILEKLGLNNNAELTRYALDNGLA